ncbi:MAG: hypothetical protein AAGF11_07150 [Myxococcota bacterium]
MLLSLVIGLGVSISFSAAAAAAPYQPRNGKARKHFNAAIEAYQAQDYDKAVAEANKGLAIEEHESLLFVLAQSERQRGDCVAAVELYSRFVEVTQSEANRENAREAKALCAEELAEEARQAQLQAELESQIEELELEPEPEPEPKPEPVSRPWYRDPLGGVLVGVGGVAVLGGGATLLAAAVLVPGRAPDYGEFKRRLDLRPQLLTAGGVTAGVGVLLAAGGALRWGLLARKAKQTPGDTSARVTARVTVAPWLSGPPLGLTLHGRF